METVNPLFVERTIQRRFSAARTLALRVKKQCAVVRQKCALGKHIRWVHRWFPFDGPCEEWVAESDCQRRGYLCELRILKRERSGRFRPNKQVRFFHAGGEADSCDVLEVRCVRLKPICGIRFHFREIELHGTGEMMRLLLWHQALCNP